MQWAATRRTASTRAESVAATMEALRDGGEPAGYPPNALTERASEQVRRFWSLAA